MRSWKTQRITIWRRFGPSALLGERTGAVRQVS